MVLTKYQRDLLYLPIFLVIFCRFEMGRSLSPKLPALQDGFHGKKVDESAATLRNENYHTSDFGARKNHPTSYDSSPPFLGSLQLERWANDVDSPTPGSPSFINKSFNTGRERIQHYYQRKNISLETPSSKAPLQQSSPTKQKIKAIVDHLAYHNAPVDVKELCESIEFVLRTQKRLLGAAKQRQRSQEQRRQKKESSFGESTMPEDSKSIHLYDLACGHGLTGMLFSCCGTVTELKIVLVDQKQPPSHAILFNLLSQKCPWIAEPNAITFVEADLSSATSLADFSSPISMSTTDTCHQDNPGMNSETTVTNLVISTHACGSLTDQVLELASNVTDENGSGCAAALAVMPCCYTGTSQGAPYGIQRALGVAWAADIQRSFYLQGRGYHSDFASIPREISPMNRILIGENTSP